MHRSVCVETISPFMPSAVAFEANGIPPGGCVPDPIRSVQVVFSDEKEGHMDADDCARVVEGVAAVLDLLAAGGDAVDDPAPIYELLAERCRHVRVALEVMTGCE